MALAAQPVAVPVLTYEDYLAEGELNKRYDILDGVRVMTNPTRVHQDILLNIAEAFRAYQRKTRSGKTIVAPCDLLISRAPLRTRQPDVLFISNEQLAKCGSPNDPTPLTAAPELVVEILSPSETRRSRDAKIADYRAMGVRECWVVSPEAETVEVLRLTSEHAETASVYSNTQVVSSSLYSDLTLPVADIFNV